MYRLTGMVIIYGIMFGAPAIAIYSLIYTIKFALSGELIIREEPQELEAE